MLPNMLGLTLFHSSYAAKHIHLASVLSCPAILGCFLPRGGKRPNAKCRFNKHYNTNTKTFQTGFLNGFNSSGKFSFACARRMIELGKSDRSGTVPVHSQ